MGCLTRDPGDSMDHARPGIYVSDRGRSYRLLPSLVVPGAWHIYPDATGELSWLGPLWPGYLAVPQRGGGYGFAVYRVGLIGDGPVGYGMNLSDICWPAEDDLLRVRRETSLLGDLAGASFAVAAPGS
jgi:hypothetical protein